MTEMANNFSRKTSNHASRPDPLVPDKLFKGWQVTIDVVYVNRVTGKKTTNVETFTGSMQEKVGAAIMHAIRQLKEPRGMKLIMDKVVATPILVDY